MFEGEIALENTMKILETEKAYSQAFEYAEQLITVLKQEKQPDEVLSQCVNAILRKANRNATELLKENKPAASIHLLQKAEKTMLKHMLENESAQISSTAIFLYNTLACAYKKIGKFTQALQSLEECVSFFAVTAYTPQQQCVSFSTATAYTP